MTVCKDGTPLQADGSRTTVSHVDRQVLVQVTGTTADDAGEYTITAVNERGKVHHAVTVEVIPAGVEYVRIASIPVVLSLVIVMNCFKQQITHYLSTSGTVIVIIIIIYLPEKQYRLQYKKVKHGMTTRQEDRAYSCHLLKPRNAKKQLRRIFRQN